MKNRALVVDDEREMCELVEAGLSRRGYEVSWTTSGREALRRVAAEDFEVVLTDLKLEDIDGLELCRQVVEQHSDLPVIVFTGFGSLDAAIGAIRVGAYDFITKPVDMNALEVAVRRAAKHRHLSNEVKRLQEQVDSVVGPKEMVGRSAPMRQVHDLVERVSQSDATVLVCGESGTGKELVARAVHRRSAYAEGPFVAINCAAVPPNLLESELFGHVAGAFTDAKLSRTGLFQKADGGTLFLDEVGELPIEMQPKLLRALQERRIRPVGGDEEIEFNTRIIAATNRDLEQEVQSGRFREDLFYRINVVKVDVPRLDQRGNDILLLAQHFIDTIGARTAKPIKGLSPAAAQRLLAYDWPGNVRELENCMERAMALTRFEEVQVEDLPDRIRRFRDDRILEEARVPEEILSLDELERRYIYKALKACKGNKTRTAQVLAVDRRTLYRKLERYEQEARIQEAADQAHESNGLDHEHRSLAS